MRYEDLLPTGIAARRLGVSREYVIHLCKSGALEHIRDAYGRRLIAAAVVEDLRRKRERAHWQAARAQREAVMTP